MSVDHEEILSEYPALYGEVDVDSPEEAEADYGYHSIGKNIQVKKNDYLLCLRRTRSCFHFSCASQFNFTVCIESV